MRFNGVLVCGLDWFLTVLMFLVSLFCFFNIWINRDKDRITLDKSRLFQVVQYAIMLWLRV